MVVVVCVTLFSCWSCFIVISKNIPSVVANYFSPIRDVENGDEKTLTHSQHQQHLHAMNNDCKLVCLLFQVMRNVKLVRNGIFSRL